MIIRWILLSIIFMFFINITFINASLNFTKLNPDLPVVELKQHRHSMDQLEPDLAQTIFGGIQHNPLERTTARPKIAVVKSPTLRGKREAFLDIKPANVKILGNEDPLPEHVNQKQQSEIAEYDNINADFNEDAPSEAVEQATTDVSFIIEETMNLSNKENPEKIIDSEIAVVTSAPTEATTTEAAASATTTLTRRIDTTLIQEVAAPTPKYNVTQNDNSPTENLDRKILAFEIDSHNKKVFEELQKRKAVANAIAEKLNNGEHEISAFSFENFEEKRSAEISAASSVAAAITTTVSPVVVAGADEVHFDEIKPTSNSNIPNVSTTPLTTTSAPIELTTEAQPIPDIEHSETSKPLPSIFFERPGINLPRLPPQPMVAVVTLSAELQPTQATILQSEFESIDRTEAPPLLDENASDIVEATEASIEGPNEEITQLPEESSAQENREVNSPISSVSDGDIIFPSISAASEAAAEQAKLQIEANAAKVGDPSQQHSQPPPPPPPKDLPGFLIPNRPILDSTVQKRRHLISNYVDPIQQQKILQQLSQQQQNENDGEFFRNSAVMIARLRSKRAAASSINDTAEQIDKVITVVDNEDIIDEEDSGEPKTIIDENQESLTVTDITATDETTAAATAEIKNTSESIVFEAADEEATTMEAETHNIHLKLVTKKDGSIRPILDDEAIKTTEIHESIDSISTTTEFLDTTQETTITAELSSSTPTISEDTPSTQVSPEPSSPTPPPTKLTKEALIANALTREEKIALLESMVPRKGINLGNIPAPKKPDNEPIDASAETNNEDAQNPWTNRYKSHIQLKLTEESREVVEGSNLKIWPQLISPEKKKEEEAKESKVGIHDFEFKDLPQPKDADLKVANDVVTKPTPRPATLIATTATPPTTQRTPVFQQPQIQQFQQPQVPENFFPNPQFSQQQRVIIIEGRRYVFQDPPPQQFQQFNQQQRPQFQAPPLQRQQQQQFFQFQTPSPAVAAPSPPSPRPIINHPSLLENPTPARPFILTTKAPRIVHAGNAKPVFPSRSNSFQSSATPNPSNLGPRVRPEELSVVRIFQHRGTTRQVFATPPTTPIPSTTTTSEPLTEASTQWIPVTFTTHPTPTPPTPPTPPFDENLISTQMPFASNRVKTRNEFFEVYDEVETDSPSSPSTTKKPKRKVRTTTASMASKSIEEHFISEISLGIVGPRRRKEEESFKDLPLRHPPKDPPTFPSNSLASKNPSQFPPRKQPKLIKLNTAGNNVGASSMPQQRATDFQGDAPIAKSDLRGLESKLITATFS